MSGSEFQEEVTGFPRVPIQPRQIRVLEYILNPTQNIETTETVDTEERASEELVEKLAAIEHDSWSGWMEYMLPRLGLVRMRNGVWELTPMGLKANAISYDGTRHCLERWLRQMQTPYSKLSEQEKESDRREVRKMLEAISGG